MSTDTEPATPALNDQADDATVPGAAARLKTLIAALNRERRRRKMSWQDFVAHLSTLGDGSHINLSTVTKIRTGRTKRPHEYTVDDLLERLDQSKAQAL